MKKFRLTTMAVVAVSCIFLSVGAVYGDELIKIIKTFNIGSHAEYVVVENFDDDTSVPKKFEGKIFDKNGNVVTDLMKVDRIYNADGVEVMFTLNEENEQILIRKEEFEHSIDTVVFNNIKEGTSYFIDKIIHPQYLPSGYSFNRVEFYGASIVDLKGTNGNNKYMDIYYTKGDEEIVIMHRFMDEETAYEVNVGEDMDITTINGHECVISDTNIDIQIGDVMYMIFGNTEVTKEEMIKIAKSLQ